MSLVSCVGGKVTWYGRQSDLEDQVGQIGEQINFYTSQITDIGNRISQNDYAITEIASQRTNVQLGANFGANPEEKKLKPDEREHTFNFLTVILQHFYKVKMILDNEKRTMQAFEKQLQNKKMQVDTQLKIAQQMAPAFEKMEDNAIKRFAPKV
ncbi:MAG TPA: hypothetical protein P5556_09555 [Candidatus Gastranaerophilales bacterium]|nr:hypothetical protein [Candidatus Gastranaerophilales bacterium]